MVRAIGLFEVTHSICAALQGPASLEGGDKCIECPATGVRHLERVLTVVWGVVLTRITVGGSAETPTCPRSHPWLESSPHGAG
eukprot:780526-Prymnesium_polylepis.1